MVWLALSRGFKRPHLPARWCSASAASPDLAFVPACAAADSQQREQLQDFLGNCRRLFVLTGAGLSTESGIPDYRSEGVGLYARTARRPMQHAEFVRSAAARRRYWARNFTGWPVFSSRHPNASHHALGRWEKQGRLHWLVTQNVDSLHSKAGSRRLTELHGCSHRVVCLDCKEITPRSELQQRMLDMNPGWQQQHEQAIAPDGDVLLSDSQVESFQVPPCGSCGGALKPEVTFFGDNVDRKTVDDVYQRLWESDTVLVAGSSLQVYSGYRFIRAAYEQKIPVVVLNIGPTRADELVQLKPLVSNRHQLVLPVWSGARSETFARCVSIAQVTAEHDAQQFNTKRETGKAIEEQRSLKYRSLNKLDVEMH